MALTWECVRFALKNGTITTEKTGSFTQLPFRLAWALTIHKSQGQTLKDVVVDLGKGAFAAGQTYVALSRSKTLEGIVLQKPVDRSSIFADPRVEGFLAACRARSTRAPPEPQRRGPTKPGRGSGARVPCTGPEGRRCRQ